MLVALAGIGVVTLLVFAAWRFGSDTPNTPIPDFSTEPPAAQPNARQRQRPVAAPKARMTVTGALGDSSMEVYANSRAGRLIYEGTVEAGRSVRFGTERTYRRYFVRIGRPANLRVTVNGRVVSVPNRGSPTEVVVTANGVRPASAA